MKFMSLALEMKFMVMCGDRKWQPIVMFWMLGFFCYLLICNMSSYRSTLLLLVMFPKHVLGMSFGFYLYGFVHISYF